MKVFLFGLFWISIFFNSFACADIGEIYDFNGQVQIKTGGSDQISAEIGTSLRFGDKVKVRRASIAHLEMVDTSKFQVGPKTTLILDEFVFDKENQILTAQIIDGVIAYDGKEMAVNSQRKFLIGSYTVTIRGTKFAAKVGKTNQIILFRGSIKIEGNGQKRFLAGPLLSVTFDESGIADPIELTLEDAYQFFIDNSLNYDLHLGSEYTKWLATVSKGGNWNFATERTKLAEGVILETVRFKKTGDIIKETVKIRYRDNYYPAIQNPDGTWELSPEGSAKYEQNQIQSQQDGSSEQSSPGEC